MSLIAGDLLADAEALAYPYVADGAVAPVPLLRTLSALDAEVTGMIVSVAPHLLVVNATPISVVFATNATGYTLVAARSYVDFKLEDSDNVFYPVRIVPTKQLDKTVGPHPCAVVEGVTLFPVDAQGNRWQSTSSDRRYWRGGEDTLHYRYVVPDIRLTTLTGATGTLASPDWALDYLLWSLTLRILLSFHGVDGNVPSEKLTAVDARVGQSRQNLWQSIANAAAASSSVFTP